MGKFIASKFPDKSQAVIAARKKSKRLKNYIKRVQECADKFGDKWLENVPEENSTPQGRGKEVQESSRPHQHLDVETFINPTSGNKCLKLVTPVSDLFDEDDLNASYEHYSNNNLIFTIFDEIALEGLDGITLEALWKRIQYSIKVPILPLHLKEIIWKIICLRDNLKFFLLPEPRKELPKIKEECSLKTYTSTFYDCNYDGPDIYKVEPAPKFTEMGSCSTYKSRIEVSYSQLNLPVQEVETIYKNKLVIVAPEQLRKHALVGAFIDPHYEFLQSEYCVLERIGRARDLGAITTGPLALSVGFGFDPKSIHHYVKGICNKHLAKRQTCVFTGSIDSCKIGHLIHLRRFYRIIKSRRLLMMESIVNLLKNSPNNNYTLPVKEMKVMFDQCEFSRLLKSPEFLKYIELDMSAKYTDYYENASYHEYMVKNGVKERKLYLSRLKDPYLNVIAAWRDRQGGESSDEEDEEEEGGQFRGGRRVFNKDLIKDVYDFILSKDVQGVSSRDVCNTFCADLPTMRIILKRLELRKLVLVKKFNVGREKHNIYIATKLFEKRDFKPQLLTPTERTLSVLEKLKQRQQQKIISLPRERVYTRNQFEADQEHQLLSLESPLECCQITVQTPNLHIDGFNLNLLEPPTSTPIENTTITTFLPRGDFKPFLINFSAPKSNYRFSLESISLLLHQKPSLMFKPPTNHLLVTKFTPDHFTKAFLLGALLGDVDINQERIINFLDPGRCNRKVEKRSLSDNEEMPHKKQMRPEAPILSAKARFNEIKIVHRDEDESKDYVLEVYEAQSEDHLKTGDITQYVESEPNGTTERVMSRIAIILRTVQNVEVFEDASRIMRVIVSEESKSGYDKLMDRKSLHRILKRLTDEGYIKMFHVMVRKEDYKKTCWIICHPKVTIHHHKLKDIMDQMRDKCLTHAKKTLEKVPKPEFKQEAPVRSPFVAEDVLQSLYEIHKLTDQEEKIIKIDRNTRSSQFGYLPKFARLSLIHEFLVYAVYEMKQDAAALPKEDVYELFKNYQITLSAEEVKQLPPVYAREISWKTFVPPLPHHQGWEEGWALLVDILLRLPMVLITHTFIINFASNELCEMLEHPFKRFFLLRDTSPEIRAMVFYKRKFVAAITERLTHLCYCGLIQFGPGVFHDREKTFFYVNRRAILWDTTTSSAGEFEVEDRDYPKIDFYFESSGDVVNYWSKMNQIAMQTNLFVGRLEHEKKTEKIVILQKAKPDLKKALTVRSQSEAKANDIGILPGDHKGAAGLDSTLFVHLSRNWTFFAFKNVVESLKSLTLEKCRDVKPPVKTPKLPSTKYYLVKQPNNKNTGAGSKTGKIHKAKNARTKPAVKFKHKRLLKRKRLSRETDVLDKIISRKFEGMRYRPNWSESEDKTLILLKIAAVFVTPGLPFQRVSCQLIRDVLHLMEPRSRDKNTNCIKNRMKGVLKDVLPNIDSLISNLYKLAPVVKYFLPYRKTFERERVAVARDKKLRDHQLQVVFIFMAYYFAKHRNEVDLALRGQYHNDLFNNANCDTSTLQLYEQKLEIYENPRNLDEITRQTLHSAIVVLLSQKRKTDGWTVEDYKILQQFKESDLRNTLTKMGLQRLVQRKKLPRKIFFTAYRLSVHYIFSQHCTFYFDTIENVYETFLRAKDRPSELDFSCEVVKDKYGQLFALNEVLSFMLDYITAHFEFPQHHLLLNPDIEDHSDVIEELAKRCQAKMKSEAKARDPPQAPATNSTAQCAEDDEDDFQAPGSTVKPQQKVDPEVVVLDDDEPLDLSITTKDSTTIDNLRHWISDCIDAERVRSPSPELLTLEIKKEPMECEETQKGEEEEMIKSVENAGTAQDSRVLTLQEIKEEMLKPDNGTSERLVPYISDLAKLLSENIEEVESDERALYLLRKHFVQKYPSLRSLSMDTSKSYLLDVLENRPSIQEVLDRVKKDTFMGVPNESGAVDEILSSGGTVEDVALADSILSYIKDKEVCGASACELKVTFSGGLNVCSLSLILEILTKHHVVLRTGVCSIVFVYHRHQAPWLMSTFKSASDLNVMSSTGDSLAMEKSQNNDTSHWYKVRPFPWITLNGNLDKDKFKLWLSQVFSYCIENPNVLFSTVCDKFCFLRPLDVFYLLEVLETLSALELRRFVPAEVELFSDADEQVEDCKATLLDPFEQLYIESNNVSFTCLGSFLCKL